MMVTKNDVSRLLAELGIPHNARLTMHISLRAVGEIDGGADGLIDAFSEYLCDGLLMIPTHTWANVNRKNPFFDVKNSEPCIGALPRAAAKRPDGVRTLHPTHSLTLFGAGAREIALSEGACHTPAPPHSLLSQLRLGGYILLIGVGHERNTFIHAVDELINMPNRIAEDGFDVTVRDAEGNDRVLLNFHPHRTVGIDRGSSEYFPRYKRALELSGAVKYAKLGNATVCACNASTTFATISALWERTGLDVCFMEEEFSDEVIKSLKI